MRTTWRRALGGLAGLGIVTTAASSSHAHGLDQLEGYVTGCLSSRAVGITGMVFTAPQVAAASYLAATSPSSSRGGWIALGAWSGGLFVHGLISAIAGNHKEDSAPPLPPPTPPDPPSSPAPTLEQDPLPSPPPPSNRPPLMVPESLRVGPMIVTDGVASAPGIGVSGVLF